MPCLESYYPDPALYFAVVPMNRDAPAPYAAGTDISACWLDTAICLSVLLHHVADRIPLTPSRSTLALFLSSLPLA